MTTLEIIHASITGLSIVGAGYAWFRLAGTRKQHEIGLRITNLIKLVDTYSDEVTEIENRFKKRMDSLRADLVIAESHSARLSKTVEEQKQIIESQKRLIDRQDKLITRYRIKYGPIDKG